MRMGSAMPSLDDYLVPGETREEMVRGRRIYAAPAEPPCGDRRAALNFAIQAHAAEGHITSADMLTRTSPDSQFATDTSVRRAGIDPATGTRYLEELAFEVVYTQSMRDITVRAEELTKRGVGRLIAIFVKKKQVAEWSASANAWVTLDLDSRLVDPVLVRPLLVRALIDTSVAHDEVVEALAAKRNRRLVEREEAAKARGHEEGREEGRAEGREEGLRRAIEAVCALLDLPLGESERAHMKSLDAAALDALLGRLQTDRRWPASP
jgi:hypothetical protein